MLCSAGSLSFAIVDELKTVDCELSMLCIVSWCIAHCNRTYLWIQTCGTVVVVRLTGNRYGSSAALLCLHLWPAACCLEACLNCPRERFASSCWGSENVIRGCCDLTTMLKLRSYVAISHDLVVDLPSRV